VAGRLFFTGADPYYALWSSDGTLSGTKEVAYFFNPSDRYPTSLVSSNGSLYFSHAATDDGATLWKSDGTAAGTHSIAIKHAGVPRFYPDQLTHVAGTVYFVVPVANCQKGVCGPQQEKTASAFRF
jgi:ELWxxDGT repeat protein